MTDKLTIIEKDGRPEYAVLPWAEYEALVGAAEDAADIAAVARIDADPREEEVPGEVANRLIDGDNPVRVWREYRGMKATDLAARTGLSQSYLSQIENSRPLAGSVAALRAIADALRISLDDLVPGADR